MNPGSTSNSQFPRGKRCEKNYSSVRRYVADLVNAYPKQSITKLILKGAVIFDVVSYQFRCALNYSKLVPYALKLLMSRDCSLGGKLGNELDVMKQARGAYRDENKNSTFAQEDAWEILRKHAIWDAPAPVDLTEDEEITEVNTDELFGPDARPRPSGKQRLGKKTKSDTPVSTRGSSSSIQFGEIMIRLKREAAETAFEVAKEKDRTVMRLEEMKFLAISTKDLSEDDAYFIEEQKKSIRAKYNLYRN
ncbi:hypothetical protein Tco_0006770 [Tanacetum coccineum]